MSTSLGMSLGAATERPFENSRNEPTALSHGRTYRRGADVVSQKSSLPFFVLIGLAVGLFAFAMMSFCLPDPFAKIAERGAAAAPTFPPPAFKPIEVAPPVAEIAVPAQVTVTTIAPAPKQARVVRHPPAKKNVSVKTLPSNPYATVN